MKKLICVVLAMLLMTCMFTGGGASEEITSGPVKTGLAVVSSLKGSKSASADAAGAVKYDLTYVAVTVDDNGVIDSCVIDAFGSESNFDTAGVITTDLTAALQTKNELGENYGMVAYGGSKYEWNEQAAALAEYACGKTVKQLKRGAVDETGYAKDADLASTATIYIGGYVDAIEKAVANAAHLGAQKGDTIKLVTAHSKSGSDASADAEGNVSLSGDMAAITFTGDVISSAIFDVLSIEVKFDDAGIVSTKPYTAFLTKNELGEDYGMKAYAGSKYEWYEQAASFASYICGKTLDEASGIALTETTNVAEADLASSVTIAVGGFMHLIEKAKN